MMNTRLRRFVAAFLALATADSAPTALLSVVESTAPGNDNLTIFALRSPTNSYFY